MKQFWKTLWKTGKQWLFPGWKVALPLVLTSAALLLYVFTQGQEETLPAYGVYTLSSYALIAGTEAAVWAGSALWRRVSAIPLVKRWRSDAYFRVRTGLALSLFLNLCYAGLRIVSAALYASVWEGALGGYYVLLCLVRWYLICRTPGGRKERTRAEQLRTYQHTGWFLMVLDLALSGVAVQIVQDGRGYDCPGTLIYAMAAYTFYTMGLAIANLVRYRKFRSPVLSAARAVNLTTALVSLFSLETAMLAQFGGKKDFQHNMTAATGVGVCALVLIMALYMVLTGRKKRSDGKEVLWDDSYSGTGG